MMTHWKYFNESQEKILLTFLTPSLYANCAHDTGKEARISFALEIHHGFTFLSGKVSPLLHAPFPVQQ
jgi:hypothetical protein